MKLDFTLVRGVPLSPLALLFVTLSRPSNWNWRHETCHPPRNRQLRRSNNNPQLLRFQTLSFEARTMICHKCAPISKSANESARLFLIESFSRNQSILIIIDHFESSPRLSKKAQKPPPLCLLTGQNHMDGCSPRSHVCSSCDHHSCIVASLDSRWRIAAAIPNSSDTGERFPVC